MSTVSTVVSRAKFAVRCHLCGIMIARGEKIRFHSNYPNSRRKRWVHDECPAVGGEVREIEVVKEVAVGGEDGVARQAVANLAALVYQLKKQLEEVQQRTPRTIEVKQPDGKRVELKGCVHPVFDKVLQLAQARKNIFLPGPAGCGKSHLAGQVAEALGLGFGFISCSAGMSESQLLGRMVPGEGGAFEFHTTQFLDCYENGGVFLFDEIDAADANVLLVINSALANGHLSVPSRTSKPVAKKHADFICIAAANTFGRGADRQYVGRNELDESTLDRFRIGTVPMDYDPSLERQLCPDETLYARLTGYRERVRDNRLERVVSTRFMKDAYEMVSQWGWTYEQVDEQLFAGWRRDEISKVSN